MSKQAGHLASSAACPTALVVVDMINTWEMQGGKTLLKAANGMLPDLVRLIGRARRAGAPVVYANDNFGCWRSNILQTIEQARQAHPASAHIVDALIPQASDYVVLKPKHSAFYATPLALLLEALDAKRLVIAGVSADQCVLATAGDALLRGYEVVVPSDAVASPTAARTRAVLKHFRDVMDIATPTSRSVRWR
jgi:nicotinamidase-related amidase